MARTFSGAQLRAARIAAGIKPEELALGIGRSAWMIYEYERGRTFPPAPVLGAMADQLDVDVDAFFTREATPNGRAGGHRVAA